jgi:GrpB-like predicted nucleotidyltransferase (UPF0157 family)
MTARAEETLDERIARVLRDEIELAEPDPNWPAWFLAESAHLRSVLPADLLGRIEHVGSTAVPGLVAKPIVDMLVEITDPERARRLLPEVLPPPAYDYFWKPPNSPGGRPYSWLIRRDGAGRRTHHLHCVPADHDFWDTIRFRDRLRADPQAKGAYADLKRDLADRFRTDREGYTSSKTAFITALLV